jgi:hypothetical protein
MSYWKRLICIVPILLLVNASLAATKPAAKPAPPKQSAPQTAAPQQPAAQSAVPQVVRARVFELVDAKGDIRASMGASEGGPVVFRLFNKDGKMAVSVDSEGGITIMNNDGKPKISVGKQGEGYGIGLHDSKGALRASLTMDADEPMLSLLDSNGKYRGMLFLQKDDPYFNLTDGQDGGAHALVYVKGSAPGVAMWDSNGKMRTSYVLMDDKSPRLLMTNDTADACLKLTVSDGLPSVEVMNPKNDIGGMFGFVNDADLTMIFTDADNKARAIMSLSDENGPYMSVAHPTGNPAATLGISDSGAGYVRTSDKDNNTTWRAP